MKLKESIVFALLLLPLNTIFAQNLIEDILTNDLDSLNKKVRLLSPTMKEQPYLAIYLNKVEDFQESTFDYLIKSGVDVNQNTEEGFNSLYYAIKRGHRVAIRKLLALKVNANIKWKDQSQSISDSYALFGLTAAEKKAYEKAVSKNESFITPLSLAISYKNVETVNMLLGAGGDPSTRISYKWDKNIKDAVPKYISKNVYDLVVDKIYSITPSRFEKIDFELYEIAKLLWDYSETAPAAKKIKISPTASSNTYIGLIQGNLKPLKDELLKSVGNTISIIPYALIAENWDAISLIAEYNEIKPEEKIVTIESGPNHITSKAIPVTLMEWSLYRGDTKRVKFLISKNINLPEKTLTPTTSGEQIMVPPFQLAVMLGDQDLFDFLIASADAKLKSECLFFAHKKPIIRDKLISSGADINVLFPALEGQPSQDLLFSSIRSNDLDDLQYYLKQGINPNRDSIFSPLILAIRTSNVKAVKILLSFKADTHVTITNPEVYDLSGGNKGKSCIDLTEVLQQGFAVSRATREAQKEIRVLLESASNIEN